MPHLHKITLLFIILLCACLVEPSFTEPQPQNKSNETRFKKKFQGNYLCLEDSSRLIISTDKIIQEWKEKFSISTAEVDSTKELRLAKGMLHIEGREAAIAIEEIGDSIYGTIEGSRTVFQITDSTLLRFYKGRYFINKKYSENNWKVQLLELTGESLSLNRIAGVEQIESLSEYTEVTVTQDEEGEPKNYHLNPTRKELKSILKASKFNAGFSFRKIE